MDVDSKRFTALHSADPNPRGDFVLYWMQIKRRAEANDALDFVVEQADCMNLPVPGNAGLRYDYPHASDRIHAFLLENARGLRKRLNEKGIGHAFRRGRGTAGRAETRREAVNTRRKIDATAYIAAIDALRRRCDYADEGA